MAKFRMIHTEFWNDGKVIEEFSPEDKYFYLYLLTNPNTTQIGIYQITKKQMAFDMGYSMDTVDTLLNRFENQYKLIRYNSETWELAIKNWGRYNLNRGGKPIMDCVQAELKQVKDISLIPYVGENVEKQEIKTLYDIFSESLHDTSDDSETIRGEEQQEEEQQEEEQQEEKEEEQQQDKHQALQFYQQNYGPLNGFMIENIIKWCDDFSDEIVIEAMKIAIKNQKRFSYAEGILRNWVQKGFKTIDDVRAEQVEFQNKIRGKIRSPVRKEKVPDWLDSRGQTVEEVPEIKNFEEEKRKMEKRLKKYKKEA